MKYISLTLLCITSSIMSMERENQILQKYSNKGYPVVIKDLKEKPIVKVSREYNEFSEKLYDNENITETDIENLVKKGAILNYATKRNFYSGRPIPLYYAFGKTEQEVKNMKKIIELGGAIRNFEDCSRNALVTAVQKDHKGMINLLMPYETSEVAIYVEKDKLESKDGYRISSQEADIRENIIHNSFYFQNIDGIKLLLELKLMSPERGIKEFVKFMNPNQAIRDLLLSYNPSNKNDILSEVMANALPVQDEKMKFFKQICTKAFNQITLKELLILNEQITELIEILKKNESFDVPIIQ